MLVALDAVHAQELNDPKGYVHYIGLQHREIAKDVLAYTSSVAHSKSARKVEHRRQAMLQQLKVAIKKIGAMPAFQGDGSLRDSAVVYLKTSLIVLNNEYGKIVDLEQVSEQSYDAMEAYLLSQDIANDHLAKAEKRMNHTLDQFAANYKVTLVEDVHDEIKQKLQLTSDVNKYHRQVYMVFFKSNRQELYLVDAIDKRNVNAIEQHKTLLAQYVKDGLNKLDTMQSYAHDRSLINSAIQALEFYKTECIDKVPQVIEFLGKEAAFNKLKKTLDAKKVHDRTDQEIAEFNGAVHTFNADIHAFNSFIHELNQERDKTVTQWNKTTEHFLDKYVPLSHY